MLSELQIRKAVAGDPQLVEREIEAALKDGDVDLAQSFAHLALAQNLPVSMELLARVDEATAQIAVGDAPGRAGLPRGFLTGDTDDLASFSGTVAGDLFVFGDIRDVVVQGRQLVLGEEPDRLVLGLAAVGLAVTAGTYASVGTASPARAGLTLLKGARKSARLSAGLTDWARRSATEMVDSDYAATGGRQCVGDAADGVAWRDQGGGQDREGGAARRRGQGCRPGRRKGRRPRRARHRQGRRQSEGSRAGRKARRRQGQPDPGDPESSRPRRAAVGRGRLQPRKLAVQRARVSDRPRRLDQVPDRAADDGLAAPRPRAAFAAGARERQSA